MTTGLDVVATAATGALAKQAVEILSQGGKGFFGWVGGGKVSQSTQQAIYTASKQYVQNYTSRHGLLKVLGMREPISLESIYTTVQLLDSEGLRSFRSLEELEKAYREQERSFRNPKARRQAGITVANETQYLMVLGAPGSGKSTFLRQIGLKALKGKKIGEFQHPCIPVLIELKRLTDRKIDLQEIITQEFEICNWPSASRFVKQALEKGRLLILLDGLDEVPAAKFIQVTETIRDFVDRYDQNRYIISSRNANLQPFHRFTDVVLAEFDDEQIEQFIGNWFSVEADRQTKTAQRCWNLLNQSENKAAKELAQTPLLLTFLCLVYNRAQTFPSNRSQLYQKALQILLEEWAAEKRILRETIYEGLSVELEEVLLAELAYQGFVADRLFFSQSELVEQIKHFLAENLNAPKQLSGKKVLEAMAVQQGILVERAENVYSFSHLVLQEYLVALYISDHNLYSDVVTKKHLTHSTWREVFLLVSGLARWGADNFLLLIEQHSQQYIKKSKVELLLNLATQKAKNLELPIIPASKRAITLIFWLNKTTLDLDLDSLYSILYRLDHDFFEKMNMEIISSPKEEKYMILKLIEGLDDFTDLNPPLMPILNLSEGEKRALENYFYLILLLIRAKESATRVSPQVWSSIKDRMFLVESSSASLVLEKTQRFFEQAGATLSSNKNGKRLEIIDLPKELRISLPISVAITLDETIEQIIVRLSKEYIEILDGRSRNIVIIVYPKIPSTIDRLEISKVRLRDQLTVIPIPLAEIENALTNANICQAILTEYMRRYIETANFFDDRNSISDRIFFFGRLKLLDQLKDDLSRCQGIGLFGLRKSGKTSVINQLQFVMREYPVARIDLQKYNDLHYGADLFNSIIQQLQQIVDNDEDTVDMNFEEFPSGTPAAKVAVEFIQRICMLSERLKSAGFKMPIVCFLDEVERIFPMQQDPRERVEEFNACFGTLRVLSQEQRNLSILVADVYPDCNRTNQWPQEGVPSNPVFSFFKEIFLSPFSSERETIEMLTTIASFMGLELDRYIARGIHYESGGYPYISRQLTRALYQKRLISSEKVKVSNAKSLCIDWEDILFDFYELSNYFEESIWKDLSKRDSKITMKILVIFASQVDFNMEIEEKTLTSLLENDFTVGEIRKAANWLISVGLISRCENPKNISFQVLSLIFFRWLKMQLSEEEISTWKII